MIGTILMVFAFVLLVLAGLGIPTSSKFQLGWWGLACWALSILLSGVHLAR
jgi:hypothetical protein